MKRTRKWLSFCLAVALIVGTSFSSVNVFASSAEEIAVYNVETEKETVDELKDVKKKIAIESDNPEIIPHRIKMTKKEKWIMEKARNLSEVQEDASVESQDNAENTISPLPKIAKLEMLVGGAATSSDEMEGIVGTDNRIWVSNTSQFPYYSTCKLIVTFASHPGVYYMGTGFALGKNLCCTARHNITDETGAFPSSVTAYFGYNNGTYTYKATDVAHYIYSPAYDYGEIINDYGFIVWQNTGTSITGCYGMRENASIGSGLKTIGYPAEQGYNGELMYECVGQITGASNDNILFNMDVARGQSGSPVFVNDGDYYVNSIVTHKTGTSYNIGYRINSDLIQWLIDNGYI